MDTHRKVVDGRAGGRGWHVLWGGPGAGGKDTAGNACRSSVGRCGVHPSAGALAGPRTFPTSTGPKKK